MDLLLIRHAEPIRLEVAEGPADPPLHERGRSQAGILAAWLALEPIDALWSSPLRRAVETAAPVGTAVGLPVQLADGVAEYDRNLSWYIPIEELKASGDARWQAMAKGDYFGEEDDEASFTARVVGAIESLVESHPGSRLAVVCHGGVINVYLSWVLGRTGSPMFFLPGYTSISRVAAQRGGKRSVLSLNETGHLHGLPS
ncbi:MAG: histidine phosphatase family protein [Acidimicrobiales bacterium]